MEWSKVDVPAPTNRPDADRPINWLQFDGLFLRAALLSSLAVSVGWTLTIFRNLGSFQTAILGEAASTEAGLRTSAPIEAELVFLLIPFFGIWMASRALRDTEDVLAIVSLVPLHLLAIPASAMIAIDATSFVATVGALASLFGNMAYVGLVWAENRIFAVG